MKKIAGILAVAALATSVFAADVSAKLRLDAKLFSFAKTGSAISVLGNPTLQDAWYNAPSFNTSVSSDKAGASFYVVAETVAQQEYKDGKLTGKLNDVTVLKLDHYSIWFKPFDAVKVEAGTLTNYALNTETIDYSNIFAGAGYGWSAAYDADGILIAANIDTSASSMIGKLDGVDATIAPLYFKAGYAADFGTIGAAVKLTGDAKKVAFGAGYANTFDAVSMFADVTYDVDKKTVGADAFVNTTVEEIGIKGYVWATIPTETAKDTKVGVKAKAEKAFDGFSGYLYVKNENVLADKFSMEVKPGITGNVGCMAYNLALDFTCAEAFAVAVPLEMSVAW